MTGFDRLKEQVKDQKEMALIQTVNYLLTREDMEQKYLNEEKTLEGMCTFIRNKSKSHMKNGWAYVTNELVYAWAIMYFSLPNQLLKIDTPKTKSTTNKSNSQPPNNVVSLGEGKKKIEQKKEVKQLSLFGGIIND